MKSGKLMELFSPSPGFSALSTPHLFNPVVICLVTHRNFYCLSHSIPLIFKGQGKHIDTTLDFLNIILKWQYITYCIKRNVLRQWYNSVINQLVSSWSVRLWRQMVEKDLSSCLQQACSPVEVRKHWAWNDKLQTSAKTERCTGYCEFTEKVCITQL